MNDNNNPSKIKNVPPNRPYVTNRKFLHNIQKFKGQNYKNKPNFQPRPIKRSSSTDNFKQYPNQQVKQENRTQENKPELDVKGLMSAISGLIDKKLTEFTAKVNSLIELKTKYYVDQRINVLENSNDLLTRGANELAIQADPTNAGNSFQFKYNGDSVARITDTGVLYCRNLWVNGLNIISTLNSMMTTEQDTAEIIGDYVKRIELKDGTFKLDVDTVKANEVNSTYVNSMLSQSYYIINQATVFTKDIDVNNNVNIGPDGDGNRMYICNQYIGNNDPGNNTYINWRGYDILQRWYSDYIAYYCLLNNILPKNSTFQNWHTDDTLGNNNYLRLKFTDSVGEGDIDFIHDTQYYGIRLKVPTDNNNNYNLTVWPTGVTISGQLDCYDNATVWKNFWCKDLTVNDIHVDVPALVYTYTDNHFTGRNWFASSTEFNAGVSIVRAMGNNDDNTLVLGENGNAPYSMSISFHKNPNNNNNYCTIGISQDPAIKMTQSDIEFLKAVSGTTGSFTTSLTVNGNNVLTWGDVLNSNPSTMSDTYNKVIGTDGSGNLYIGNSITFKNGFTVQPSITTDSNFNMNCPIYMSDGRTRTSDIVMFTGYSSGITSGKTIGIRIGEGPGAFAEMKYRYNTTENQQALFFSFRAKSILHFYHNGGSLYGTVYGRWVVDGSGSYNGDLTVNGTSTSYKLETTNNTAATAIGTNLTTAINGLINTALTNVAYTNVTNTFSKKQIIDTTDSSYPLQIMNSNITAGSRIQLMMGKETGYVGNLGFLSYYYGADKSLNDNYMALGMAYYTYDYQEALRVYYNKVNILQPLTVTGTTAPLTVNNSTTTNGRWQDVIRCYAPSLQPNGGCVLAIGVNSGTRNRCQLHFNYADNNSWNNHLEIAIEGHGGIAKFYPSEVNIGPNLKLNGNIETTNNTAAGAIGTNLQTAIKELIAENHITPKITETETNYTNSFRAIPTNSSFGKASAYSPDLKLFVNLGYNTGRGYYSYDGVSWIQMNIPSAPFQSVVWGDSGFVAICYSNRNVYTSLDGINWTLHSNALISLSSYFWKIVYTYDIYVVILDANSQYCQFSVDGVDWNQMYGGHTSATWRDMYYANGRWVVVGERMYWSTCTTWGDWTGGQLSPTTYNFTSVTYGKKGWIAVGQTYYYKSTNGTTWTQGTLPTTGIGNYALYSLGRYFIIPAQNQTIPLVTYDLVTFQPLQTFNYGYHYEPVAGNGVVVAPEMSENVVDVYNPADSFNNTRTILESVYPVGAIYTSFRNISPLKLFGFGSWTSIFTGYERQCVGSQVLYKEIIGTGPQTNVSLLGAYSYTLIEGVFANITIPSGYHKEYRLTFQGSNGGSGSIQVFLNNIGTNGVGTWSGNTFRVLGGSNYFKESDITLETTMGYQNPGINLKFSSSGNIEYRIYNITIHGFIVSDTQTYKWKRTA